jgi:hypothetical protein
MNALTHITIGRTATRLILVAVLLTAAVAGTSGMAAAEPMDGKGNDPFPPMLASLDGKGNDVYPPPSRNSLDWTGGDAAISAFPIDNVTVFTATYVGRGGGSGKPSF